MEGQASGLNINMNPRDRIHALLSKPVIPSKDWARRILDDPHASELQKRMAKDALKPRLRRESVIEDGEPF